MNSHLSEERISEWIAGERSREAEQHLHDCPECAQEVSGMENAMLLFRDSGHQAADYWQKQPTTSASHDRLRLAASAVAIAVAIIAAVTLYRPSIPEAVPKQEVFLRVPYVAPPAPYERTEVVRMDVPVAALIAAGFKMNAPAADSVYADILLGQDGRPLAVGFPENK
jgi:hypothetical protein